jgi:hypothetical protein
MAIHLTQHPGGDMSSQALIATQSSNFELKNEVVELVRSSRTLGPVTMSVDQLEAIRVEGPSVPASTHGLETICGASCETGAQ